MDASVEVSAALVYTGVNSRATSKKLGKEGYPIVDARTEEINQHSQYYLSIISTGGALVSHRIERTIMTWKKDDDGSIVIDISKDDNKKDPIYFVNPELTWQSKEKATYEEGCLSIPDQFAKIDRPEKCIVKFLDYNGKPKELKAEGLLATCIQHEIDHLNGVLFIDYLSKLKKDIIIKKLSKNKKELERIVV